jgi:neural Wiskott-Aldrich syndrome protein
MQSNRPSQSRRSSSFSSFHTISRISLAHPTPSGSLSSVKSAPHNLDLEAELERDLLLGMEDAEGEPDDEFEEILPIVSPVKALKQEEEEGSEHEIQIPKQKAEIASRSTNPKPSVNVASRAKPSATRPPSAQKQNNAAEKAKGNKRTREPVINADEEDLEFGKPTRPAKFPRTSPPTTSIPAVSPGLCLPTAQTTGPKIPTLPLGGGPSQPPQTSAPPPQPLADISDSEDEWDEVPAVPAPHTGVTVILGSDDLAKTARNNESDEEEIDEHAFEAELNEQLREDDEEDFLARAVSPEPEHSISGSGAPIMSLNQYAGGDVFGDDDYSSSSEESDD